MMKGMLKRALGVVAAAAMAATGMAGLAGTANAAENQPTITVTGDVSGENRTFTAYPLASYENPVPGENGCASSVDLIQNTTWAGPTIADAAKKAGINVTSQYKNNEISYVAANAHGQQLRDFASALAAAGTKPTGTPGVLANGQVTFDVPSEGWYLIVDTLGSPLLASTKITGTGDTVYQCLAGQPIGTAVAKPSTIPAPGKVVLDENGDVVVDEDGNPVQDISALVGSKVTFKVTSNVPNHTSYTSYDWKIVDTPTDGLQLDTNAPVQSVTIDSKEVPTTDYKATVDDNVLTVDFTNITGYAVGAPIVITYQATVTKGALDDAINSVVAKHDETTSGAGTVTVKSFGFQFTKTEADGKTPLPGAKFTVQKDNASGQYLTPDDAATQDGWKFTVDEHEFEGVEGVFSFQGLPAGVYYVHETQVPTGYMQNVRATFTVHISDTGVVTVDDSALGMVVSGDTGEVSDSNPIKVMNVQSITQLPLTGAAGITAFIVLGLLIAGVGVTVYMKSRNVRRMMRA